MRIVRLAALAALAAAAAVPAPAQTKLSAADLRRDVAIVRRAYTSLHPALYRYARPAEIERHFAALERDLDRDRTLAETYLAFSRFLARIRCGHTYPNFWNQPAAVRAELFDRADKLPFAFRIVDRRLLVTGNASDEPRAGRGTEIVAVDGVPVRRILDALVPYVKGDGSNDAKRLYDLQVTGAREHEAFDVYFPLLFPPADGRYRVEAREVATGRRFAFTTPAVSRARRRELLEARVGPLATSVEQQWQFRLLDDRVAYMRIGTFVVYNSKFDWRGFLAASFDEMAARGVESLVVDLRGNEGGSDDVGAELARRLARVPIRRPAMRQLLRYERTPADLDAYLETWDDSFRNREGTVRPLGDGFYTWSKAAEPAREIPAWDGAFRGRVFVLVDAGNSSATFLLASALKHSGAATLVGQTTGGNLRGTTGGQLFFLRLPGSKIEMDIPLVANMPLEAQPDAGLEPDVYVRPRAEEVARGEDPELRAALRLARRGASRE